LELEDRLTLHLVADRLPELPAPCASGGTPSSRDPALNFEVYFRTFAEQYAFFDLHGVDWDGQYDRYRPMITDETTSDELFAVLSEMTAPLQDPHVSLVADDREFTARVGPDWSMAFMPDIEAYLAVHYLRDRRSLVLGDGRIAYRRFPDGIGYLSIREMAEYGQNEAEELLVVAAAIDRVIEAAEDSAALVIDVRFNSGGYDGVSLQLASRFADQRRLAWTKWARPDGAKRDSSPVPREFYVQPEGPRQYRKPIVVLTSSITVSAAEMFVLAMRTLPNVVVMGEPTAGAHSDALVRSLPNGWSFTLSNETYAAADGARYEKVGIPPDVPAELEPAGFAADQDSMLAAARDYLNRP
jgi:hypothetical protein